MKHNMAWEFRTEHFRVALEIEPEECDPADCFEFDKDIEAVRNGDVEWFCAIVSVYATIGEHNETRVGYSSLGACAYASISDFYTSHRDPDPMNRNCTIMRASKGKNVGICHYFPSMVAEAIQDARKYLAKISGIEMRY